MLTTVADTIDNILLGTTGSVVVQAWNRGWDEAAPVNEYPLAQRSEILDSVTCRLCRAVDGRIFDRRKEARFNGPLHINCRGISVHIHKDEVGPDGRPTQPDWPADDELVSPDDGEEELPLGELIDKHGHFVSEPAKYGPLRVPARPTGRDFIAYRRPGEKHVALRWRDNLPDDALRETLQDMAAGFANLRKLSKPGDHEMALQIMGHAAEREVWHRHLSDNLREHADDWRDAAGVLSDDELRTIPDRMLLDVDGGETRMCTRLDREGDEEWILYNPRLDLDRERYLHRVNVVYAPRRGQIIHWYGVGDPYEELVGDDTFSAIFGNWDDLQ